MDFPGGIPVTKETVPKLTPGSRYRVMSMMTRDEPLETEGTFKGYSMVGNIDALVIDTTPKGKGKGKEKGKEKGKGKGKQAKGGKEEEQLRLIPTQMVIFIEILDQVEEKKEEEEASTSRYYM